MKLIRRFASTMAASQQGQIGALLQQGVDSGRYETTADVQQALQSLGEFVEAIPVPLFTYFQVAAHELVDTGRLNSEFRLLQLDMETIYTELDAIQDMVVGHEDWLTQKITDTKNALSLLDTQVSTLELLADESDFNLAYLNTFNMLGSGHLSRAAAEAGSLYVDPRTNSALAPSTQMVVDVHKEGLVLPVGQRRSIPIMGIGVLEGHDSTYSQLDVDPNDNNLVNVLTEGDGLYWVRGVLIADEDAFHNSITPLAN